MPDVNVASGFGLQRKFRDMGDGTHAEVVSTSEGGGAVTAPGGATSSLPLTITLNDGTERIVGMQGVALPRSISWAVAAGDTVTIRYRFSETGVWYTLGAYTANGHDALTNPINAVSLQRTAGSGTTSTVTLA